MLGIPVYIVLLAQYRSHLTNAKIWFIALTWPFWLVVQLIGIASTCLSLVFETIDEIVEELIIHILKRVDGTNAKYQEINDFINYWRK